MIVVRADATALIGTGHVMRCLALAQAWQNEKGRAMFLTAAPAPALADRLAKDGIEVFPSADVAGSDQDADATVAMAREINATAVVVDGYHFGAEFQDRVKAAKLRLLFLDDNAHASRYSADWVLNQNPHADASMYPRCSAHTQLLLGSSFALLRREFNAWRGRAKEISDRGRRVLVTMGGSDLEKATQKVIDALGRIARADLEVVVVAGGNNPHLDSLRAAVAESPASIRLENNVTDMPELMSWADIAVTAGGSTCWELALLGLPACILVTADNQTASAARLHEKGVVLNLGRVNECTVDTLAMAIDSLLENSSQRRALSELGQQLVDGFGAERVAAALRKG